jgi:uroporphyrin-III C-methyltransferase/precorrin-2 dehydrogenase/sirohydrochlorin ferrochelatase
VTFVTGHGADEEEPDVDWAALARAGHTLAVYMGLSTAGRIARRLIDGGLPAGTPVAAVEKGSLPDQRVVTGTLGDLEALLRAEGVEGPALILIGEVVRLGAPAALAEALPETPPRLAAAV